VRTMPRSRSCALIAAAPTTSLQFALELYASAACRSVSALRAASGPLGGGGSEASELVLPAGPPPATNSLLLASAIAAWPPGLL
jgi:hypothetical protein